MKLEVEMMENLAWQEGDALGEKSIPSAVLLTPTSQRETILLEEWVKRGVVIEAKIIGQHVRLTTDYRYPPARRATD